MSTVTEKEPTLEAKWARVSRVLVTIPLSPLTYFETETNKQKPLYTNKDYGLRGLCPWPK